MNLRWRPAIIVVLACLAMTAMMFMLEIPVNSPVAGVAQRPVAELPLRPPGQPQYDPADSAQARRMLEEATPVELDFDQKTLPEVIDELVRQTGIQVTADFAPEHETALVSMQMIAPPFMVLQTIAAEHGMELLQTQGGWWLRPLEGIQRVCYRIHDLGADAEAPRVGRLMENLRKIVSDKSGAESAEREEVQVTLDADGIHISAPRDAQNMAAAFLESAFHRVIEARREDVPASP